MAADGTWLALGASAVLALAAASPRRRGARAAIRRITGRVSHTTDWKLEYEIQREEREDDEGGYPQHLDDRFDWYDWRGGQRRWGSETGDVDYSLQGDAESGTIYLKTNQEMSKEDAVEEAREAIHGHIAQGLGGGERDFLGDYTLVVRHPQRSYLSRTRKTS